MIKELNATVDVTGDAGYFVNVTTGGYGVQLPEDAAISLDFLAALLSSELLSWVLKRGARAWRGEWMGARAANLKRLPIVEPSVGTQTEVVELFESCRGLATEIDSAVSDRDKELLGRVFNDAIAHFDSRVFDLYGITNAELRVIRSS